ncbi:MAG TPA: purine-nucleoside phosphorylase [Actinocrinis sp.]
MSDLRSESDPYTAAQDAAKALTDRLGAAPEVALVLGSGWVAAADALGAAEQEFPVTGLPGFAMPTALGHAGRVRAVRLEGSGKLAVVFLGRTHLYEGHGVAQVVHGVRSAVAAGCSTVVLTNGCGGVNAGYSVGQPVLISDHLNMTATSPLVGARFVDLTDLYSARLRALCKQVEPSLAEGVYVQLPGPHYETPAEIRMVRTLGADLVGMSTALEAIAVREAGAEVLGISLVTNMAAGMSGKPLDAQEVIDTGNASAARIGALLRDVLGRISRI